MRLINTQQPQAKVIVLVRLVERCGNKPLGGSPVLSVPRLCDAASRGSLPGRAASLPVCCSACASPPSLGSRPAEKPLQRRARSFPLAVLLSHLEMVLK